MKQISKNKLITRYEKVEVFRKFINDYSCFDFSLIAYCRALCVRGYYDFKNKNQGFLLGDELELICKYGEDGNFFIKVFIYNNIHFMN